MTRKITIAAALAAAVLLAALIWLSLRDDPMLSETSTPLEGVDGGDAALMEEAQSPVQPQETPAADGEPSADSGAPNRTRDRTNLKAGKTRRTIMRSWLGLSTTR